MSAPLPSLDDLTKEHLALCSGVNAERQAAFANFEKKWSAHEAEFVASIPSITSSALASFDKEMAPDQQQRIVQMHVAAAREKFEAGRYKAAHELEKVLPTPYPWKSFLKDKSQEHPGLSADQIKAWSKEEARSISGASLSHQPVNGVMNLSHRVTKEGEVMYTRAGVFDVIKDTGPRLDVLKTDPSDIEAAIKIAAEKFDKSVPITLTGSAEFKAQAALFAARHGLILRDRDDKIQQIYDTEKARVENRQIGGVGDPNAVVGKEKQPPEPMVQLNVSAEWVKAAQAAGYSIKEQDGEQFVEMPPSRVLAADANLDFQNRDSTAVAFAVAAAANPALPNLGIPADLAAKMHDVSSVLMGPDGKLTSDGMDWLLYDSHQRNRTAYREQQAQLAAQKAEEKTMDDNRKIIRNVDQQSEHLKDEKKKEHEHEHEHEQEREREQEVEIPGRIHVPMPRRDIGMER